MIVVICIAVFIVALITRFKPTIDIMNNKILLWYDWHHSDGNVTREFIILWK